MSENLKGMVSETVATLGASEGGACAQEGIMEGGGTHTFQGALLDIGGIGPKGRSFRDYTL